MDSTSLPRRIWGVLWRLVTFAVLTVGLYLFFGLVITLMFFWTTGLPDLPVPPVAGSEPGLMAWAPVMLLTWALPMLAASLVSTWTLLRFADHQPLRTVGLPRQGATSLTATGVAVGVGLVAATVFGIAALQVVEWTGDDGTLPGLAAMLVGGFLLLGVAAAWEELVFRGYPFQLLLDAVGAWPAAAVMSLIFSGIHAANQGADTLPLLNVFLAGLLLSAAYLRTRTLWFPFGIHLGWNWALGFIFDFPVSGLDFDVPVYEAVASGPVWLTGGAYGPEGSLLHTVVSVVAIAWLARRGAKPLPMREAGT